jgi:hypothetical protein
VSFQQLQAANLPGVHVFFVDRNFDFTSDSFEKIRATDAVVTGSVKSTLYKISTGCMLTGFVRAPAATESQQE